MMRFRYAATSHPGLVRDNNEDAGYADGHLLLVADGVGGAPAGEVASASATYVVSAVSMICDGEPLDTLREAVDLAYQHLRAGSEQTPSRQGMSTTLTAILTDGERFGLAHLGDSRGFLLRDGQCHQITNDHTLVQLMVDSGQLTEEEAADMPFRAIIAKSLTADGAADPDLLPLDLQAGDRILLASDGLTDLVSADVMGATATKSDLESALDELVEHALAAGGRDNITCVLAEVVNAEDTSDEGETVGAARDPGNRIDGSVVMTTTGNGQRHALLREPEPAAVWPQDWPESRAG